ncbi:hypothetical protein Tco_1472187, partial [Tanacetum coccineum]
GVLDLSSLSRVWKSRTCDPILKDSSGNVMGIHDFFCLPEWIGLEVQEEIHHDMRPTLKRLPFYCTPLAAGNVAIPLLLRTLRSLSVLNQQQPIALEVLLGPLCLMTTRHDEKSEDDDDTCYEIPIITPIHSAATILAGGNQGGGFAPSVPEGPSNRDSRGKAIMDDVVDTPIRSAGHSQAFTGPTPDGVVAGSYKVSREDWEGPHQPTLSILTKEMFKDPNVYKTVVDQFHTLGEMVRIESLTDERLAGKISVLYFLMMSHGGICSIRQFQVTGLNDKVTDSDVAFVKAKAKGREWKKKIKSLPKTLNQFTADAARLASDLNQA